jgi:hypothetical protein
MNPIRPGGVNRANLLPQPRKIGGKNGWGDQNGMMFSHDWHSP